uniref:alpha-1A adrenergic receptor-like n=1 Tax=Styela clava TaxID=7725 RepID=UPI00193A7022|nr:alpha-1A adrenergic receptor-like [Styela clava]
MSGLLFTILLGLCTCITCQKLELADRNRQLDINKNVGIDPIRKRKIQFPPNQTVRQTEVPVTTKRAILFTPVTATLQTEYNTERTTPTTTTTNFFVKPTLGVPVTTRRLVISSTVPPTFSKPASPELSGPTKFVPPNSVKPISLLHIVRPAVVVTRRIKRNTQGVTSSMQLEISNTLDLPVLQEFENQTEMLNVGPPPMFTRAILATTPASNQTNDVNNQSRDDQTILVDSLCGYPVYYNRIACHELDYFTQPLSLCEERGGMIAFVFFVVVLGLTIIFLNCLLPIVVWQRSDMRTQYDCIKVSLSVADMLSGFLLLTAIIPNTVWIRKYNEEKVVELLEKDTNSSVAIIVGSLVNMSGQASLLHLMFLSIERFIAIKWSFWHLLRRTRTIIITLSLIWITTILCAFIPAAFSQYFEYKLQPPLLIHMVTLRTITEESGEVVNGIHGPLYTAIPMILPYTIMCVACIMTGIVSYKKLTRRAKTFGADGAFHATSGKPSASTGVSAIPVTKHRLKTSDKLRPEVSVFITILIMILGFTVTILPFGIVLFLFVAGVFNCNNYTTPYTVSFYVGLANGFINPIIYSFRDERFRIAVKKIFCFRLEDNDGNKYLNLKQSSTVTHNATNISSKV